MTAIYLDNSATTKPYPEVIKLVAKVSGETYANPSSLHEPGLAAEIMLSKARRQVARPLNAQEGEIVFTSGGTEANNLALIGAAMSHKTCGKHIVTSQSEHPSVLGAFKYLEQHGFKASYLPVNLKGSIDLDMLEQVMGKDTILASIMHVNNETGAVAPLKEMGRLIKEKNKSTLFHVDAVQSLAKLALEPETWQADLISVSAHKIHGPKGVGALWVKPGVVLTPLFYGGGQEKGLRPGTENTAALAGFGLATALGTKNLAESGQKVMALKLEFYRKLQESGLEFKVNGPTLQEGAPHILNLAFPGIKAETMLHFLEKEGLYVSAGSACHAKKPTQSHVLKALGLEDKYLDSSLRFSFSALNAREEVLKAAELTIKVAGELRALFS